MQSFFSAIDSTTTCLNSLQQLSNNYHEGMASGGRSGRLVSTTTIDTYDASALSSQHGVSSNPPVGNTSTVTATKRNGRGLTRGKTLEKMTKSTGKLPVTIEPMKGRSADVV